MNAFTTTYENAANLNATIVQANTREELNSLVAANLNLFNASQVIRDKVTDQHNKIYNNGRLAKGRI